MNTHTHTQVCGGVLKQWLDFSITSSGLGFWCARLHDLCFKICTNMTGELNCELNSDKPKIPQQFQCQRSFQEPIRTLYKPQTKFPKVWLETSHIFPLSMWLQARFHNKITFLYWVFLAVGLISYYNNQHLGYGSKAASIFLTFFSISVLPIFRVAGQRDCLMASFVVKM